MQLNQVCLLELNEMIEFAHYANRVILVTNSIIFSLVHSLVMIANVISNLNIGNSHLHFME